MLLQILVGGLFVFIVFFLVFRGIKSGHLPRHDDQPPEDEERKDES
ncbi:hypothetical protein P9D34_02700 [Bacillus swezeyi]|nr:hypothetical protein [Bacillus swezeyi]MEC1259372.1 hypothetical protein [Bacillus swezeyi]MED1740695.1 hypothetical protein [Bacillus swezeyi]MED2927666.1 hypothetical protein [Bacillus swezeyi]MED2941926.1 hypothetical protein [Bacillus swezeyi]MED2965421.1 hypothetical protein [Bacillus swezeyi]